MAPSNEATVPSTRRVRKSIGAHAEMKRTTDKENATIDVARTLADNRKKSRSKSMGPGGLDALKHGTGNRRTVSIPGLQDVHCKTNLTCCNSVHRRSQIDS